MRGLGRCCSALCACLSFSIATQAAEISLIEGPGEIGVLRDGEPFAVFAFDDPTILRPYFHGVRAPNGVQVTRNHPPNPETDATDHETMHPGMWAGYGDISGADFWRNKGRVHTQIISRGISGRVEESSSVSEEYLDTGRLDVENTYEADGKTVCTEICRYTFKPGENGTLFIAESEFFPASEPIVFGDQEEMGFGMRLATPLTVKSGKGRMRDSDGNENEAPVRRSNAKWVDYSAEIDGERVGVLLMPSPENFRPSWYHARDYGLLVANPFGRNALTGGEKSSVEVPPGESLKLSFAVFIYAIPAEKATREFYDGVYEVSVRSFAARAGDR